MMKGLPLAYNKDLQEDKEAIFDAVDTLRMCLAAFTPMIETMKVLPQNMRAAAAKGFINATDCADFLVNKGMPFRTAYRITGELVALCIEKGLTLETLPLEEYQKESDLFDESVYGAISLERCVDGRNVLGGPAPQNVEAQAGRILKLLEAKQK
jgi:argininosuccinate lyase